MISRIPSRPIQSEGLLQNAKPRPATPAWPKIDALLQDEIRAAISCEKTVQEALDEAAEQADSLLAQYAN